MPISFFTWNLFEIGVTAITGNADTGYPKARLWDRCGVLYWKDTAGPADYIFMVEQVGSDGFGYSTEGFGYDTDTFGYDGDLAEVDLLYVAGHNFVGHACYWQYSDNGANWTDQENWTQADSNPIVKTISSAESRKYWRLKVANITNPICGEIIISKGVSFTIMNQPRPQKQPSANVSWNGSIGGLDRSIKNGPKKDGWEYLIRIRSASDLVVFESAIDNLDEYSKPFILQDMNNNYLMVRLLNEPPIEYDPPLTKTIDINVIETI